MLSHAHSGTYVRMCVILCICMYVHLLMYRFNNLLAIHNMMDCEFYLIISVLGYYVGSGTVGVFNQHDCIVKLPTITVR